MEYAEFRFNDSFNQHRLEHSNIPIDDIDKKSILIGHNESIKINKLERKRVLQLAQLIKHNNTKPAKVDVRYNKYTKLNLLLETQIEKDYGNYFKKKFEGGEVNVNLLNQVERKMSDVTMKSVNFNNRSNNTNNNILTNRVLTSRGELNKRDKKPKDKSVNNQLFITLSPSKSKKYKLDNKNYVSITTIGNEGKSKDSGNNMKYVMKYYPERFNIKNQFNKDLSLNSYKEKRLSVSNKLSQKDSIKHPLICKSKTLIPSQTSNDKEYNKIIDLLNVDFNVYLSLITKEKFTEKFPNLINTLKLSSDKYNKFFHLNKEKVIDLQKSKLAFVKQLNKKQTSMIKIRKDLERIQNSNDDFILSDKKILIN